MRTQVRHYLRGGNALRAAALGALVVSSTGLAGLGVGSARAQVRSARHVATINPLLRAQMLQMGVGRMHTLRAQQARRPITVIVRSDHDVSAPIRAMGGRLIADIAGHIVAAQLPPDRVTDLALVRGVVALYPDETTHPRLDQSVPEIGANRVWTQHDNAGLPLQGNHVIVGVVDSGIDYHNADFKNADGTTRIKYIWDQTIDGRVPSGFNFGYECDAASINRGACPEKDTDGHGTHVTGIAAGDGNSSGGREVGVAPRADIIVVKRGGHISQDLAAWQYLLQKSQELHEPIAINNSFGGMISPHNGTSDLDLAADQIVGPGHILVAAAGNEANGGLHADATVGNGGTTSVPLTFTGYDNHLTLGLYYRATNSLSFTLRNLDTGETYGPVAPGGEIDSATARDGGTRVTVVSDRWDSNYREIALLMSNDADPLKGHYSLDIKGTQVTDSGRFDAWIDQDQSAQFSHPDESDTINEPGDSHNVIAVGNYATRTSWTDRQGVTHTVCQLYLCDSASTIQPGEINFSSSMGPTSDGREKPDISAPGTMIVSSLSHDAPICATSSDTGCLDPMLLSSDGVSLVDTGTSMSSPHVTGVAALMLQADPRLDQPTATSILRTTARRDSFTGSAAWTPAYGAGKVDAFAAVETSLAVSRESPPTPNATALPASTATPTVPPPSVTATPPTPTPSIALTSFNVSALRLQTAASGAARQSVKVGRPLYLYVYWHVDSLPVNTRPNYWFTAARRGKTVLHDSFDGTKPSYPTGDYWGVFPVTFRKPGVYVLNGGVMVGTVSRTGSTSITVHR